MTEMLKRFILVYSFITVIFLILQINFSIDFGFHTIDKFNNFSSVGVFTYLYNFFNFIVSLLFFTIPNETYSVFIVFVNSILWTFRIIVTIELLPYIRDLFKL